MEFIYSGIKHFMILIMVIVKESLQAIGNYYKSSLPLLFICFFFFITSCDEKEEMEVPVEVSSMTDIDGNVYKTVKIGNQWWMAENLAVTTYRNGVAITSLIDDLVWNDTIAGYCTYNGGYGKLYNGYAVVDTNNIAPAGWHIPTDTDWKKLEAYLGMSGGAADRTGWRGTSEGDKLKAQGVDKWFRYGEVWGTDSYQFRALGGSCRIYNGSFGNPGINYTGFWWTSSVNANELFFRYLDYKKSGIYRGYDTMKMGCSIRCVKD